MEHIKVYGLDGNSCVRAYDFLSGADHPMTMKLRSKAAALCPEGYATAWKTGKDRIKLK